MSSGPVLPTTDGADGRAVGGQGAVPSVGGSSEPIKKEDKPAVRTAVLSGATVLVRWVGEAGGQRRGSRPRCRWPAQTRGGPGRLAEDGRGRPGWSWCRGTRTGSKSPDQRAPRHTDGRVDSIQHPSHHVGDAVTRRQTPPFRRSGVCSAALAGAAAAGGSTSSPWAAEVPPRGCAPAPGADVADGVGAADPWRARCGEAAVVRRSSAVPVGSVRGRSGRADLIPADQLLRSPSSVRRRLQIRCSL